MKVFIHTGSGHLVGSCIIAVAPDKTEAKLMIRRELDEHELPNEEVNIREINTERKHIAHCIDGDY